MELFKRNIVLYEGGGAGGNAIDIDSGQVSSIASQITDEVGKLQSAFNNANAAVEEALSAFDEGDSNKAALTKVLHNGTTDISEAINTINDFVQKLMQSSDEWKKAEADIADALSAALASISAAQ
jgi:hypothetical protein